MTAILNNTATMLSAAHTAAQAEASVAAQAFLDKHYNGHDHGACGFAWVTYSPKNKGNTRLGKQERRMIESLGFSKDWTGKSWQLWNPADARCQNVDAKYAGAKAYADRFEALTGVSLYAQDRLD